MDGRRRLAEPVTEGADMRQAAAAAPVSRRARMRAGTRNRLSLGRTRLERYLRRWLGPIRNWQGPRGAGFAAVVALVLASAAFGVVRGGHLPAIASELRDLRDSVANTFGFRITSIALAGQHQLTREEILTIAGVTGRTSLLFLDVADVRNRLKANSWIADAKVLKLYPGRLRIAVTERKAFALWQLDGKVSVISDDGTVVESHVSKQFSGLPLVVGVGAETRAKAFLAGLGKFPVVRDRLHAAVLVAGRRWNVVLRDGIDIRLPETGTEQALATLLQLDRDKKLLSRDIAAIDLRLPDRVTVRLSDAAWAAREESIKHLKTKKKGGSA